MVDPSDLDEFFSVPVIWTPEQSESDWEREVDLLFQRAKLTQQFVDGTLPPSDFAEVLAESGIDPYFAAECWERGFQVR